MNCDQIAAICAVLLEEPDIGRTERGQSVQDGLELAAVFQASHLPLQVTGYIIFLFGWLAALVSWSRLWASNAAEPLVAGAAENARSPNGNEQAETFARRSTSDLVLILNGVTKLHSPPPLCAT